MKLVLGYKVELDTTRPLVSGEIKNPSNFILEDARHQPLTVLSLGAVAQETVTEVDGIRLIALPEEPSRGLLRYIYRVLATYRALQKHRDSLRDVTTVHSHASFLGLGWLAFARRTGHPATFYSTPHGTNIPEISTEIAHKTLVNRLKRLNAIIQGKLDAFVYKRSRLNFLPSAFQKAEMTMIYGIPEAQQLPIYNGAPARYHDDGRNRSVDVLFVGRAAKKKGLDVLLRIAVARPELSFRAILGTERFITVGKEVLEALKSAPNIKVLWAVPENDMPEHFRDARILLCASTGYESLPTVIIEAIASGCIPLAPRAWGIPEVIGDDRLLFDEGNEAQMLAKLDAARANPGGFASYTLIAKRLETEVRTMNDVMEATR